MSGPTFLARASMLAAASLAGLHMLDGPAAFLLAAAASLLLSTWAEDQETSILIN